MSQSLSNDNLNEFASAANTKVYTSQADLNPNDKPAVEMYAWCARQGDIVVMTSGLILTSNPLGRNVRNCKIVMHNKGLTATKVVAADRALIDMLLANTQHAQAVDDGVSKDTVSEQQQRLRLLVREALRSQVSDIHIEVRENIARIRFRQHGELALYAEWLPKLGREVASVAFNKETDHAVSHFNPLIPQSASMSLRIDGQGVRLRLASIPAHGGFDVVMRVLTTGEEAQTDLEELGYAPTHLAILGKACAMPHGAILVAGPTGSGKTTTVASCLQLIKPHRKVYTIEEPVEKLVGNASQVPINTEHDDRGFASMGRAALRMDPDVIALGEMRDEQTAKVMIRAALTGHLVLSTLHTNSATAIVTRLVDMGLSPSLLADGHLLLALICQRLVPVLCKDCARPVVESDTHRDHIERWHRVFADDIIKVRVRGQKCQTCNNTGLTGRTVIAEVIWIDEAGRDFIHRVDTVGWERYLRDNGWQSHRDHALHLVSQGVCDPIDVEHIVGEIHPDFTQNVFNYRHF